MACWCLLGCVCPARHTDAVEVEEPVEKKKTRRGKRRNKQAEEDDVERDASGKVVLEPMPMTEREKRKQKHRKQRAK